MALKRTIQLKWEDVDIFATIPDNHDLLVGMEGLIYGTNDVLPLRSNVMLGAEPLKLRPTTRSPLFMLWTHLYVAAWHEATKVQIFGLSVDGEADRRVYWLQPFIPEVSMVQRAPP